MKYSEFDGPVFDCDFHLYETADAFTRYLPSKYSDVVQLVEVKGRTKIALRGRISEYLKPHLRSRWPHRGRVWSTSRPRTPPGSPSSTVTPMCAIPEFTDKDARIHLMDRMHLQATLNYPTLASVIEVNFMDDPEITQVLMHAFNQWLYDEWTFDHEKSGSSLPR